MNLDRFGSIALLTAVLSYQGIELSESKAEPAKTETYKIQLITNGGREFTIVPFIDTNRAEWVVVTVNGKKVKLLHSTNIATTVGLRNWYDHPVTLIRMCLAEDFDAKNCKVTQGDEAELPKGKSIYDVSIDFKFIESDLVVTRSFQISKDTKPIEIK